MVQSTVNPSTYSISVKDQSGNATGLYLYLDNVNINGKARILEFFNIREGTITNEFDNSTTQVFNYDQRTIPWTLPQYYIKDGIVTEIGHFEIDNTGKTIRIVNTAEVLDYITANAQEIAGFAIQTKITYVRL